MDFIQYEIKKGDTLKLIAEKLNLDIAELIKFHNQYCGVTQQIIFDELPMYLKYLYIEKKNIEENIDEPNKPYLQSFEKVVKYRCEQDVFTEINSVPVSNATTKRDYIVDSKIMHDKLFVKVKLLDNVLKVNPDNYTEAANLVANLDLLKCNDVILQVNEKDGSILKIVNHEEIIAEWKSKKEEFEKMQNKVGSDAAKRDLFSFIELIDNQIMIEKNLIDDYKGKIFFDIYFNKFLVNSSDKLDSYETEFKSQLFEGQRTKIGVKQDVLGENQGKITIRKVSEMLSDDSSRAEQLYNERYKPMIDYQFSSYKASYRERSTYDTDTNTLEELDVTIMEQVVNNLSLRIHYTVRKID